MAHFKRGNLQLKTNQQIQLGDSQESLIKYDGTDLVLSPSGGDLVLSPSGGAVKLHYNSSEVIQTITTGLQAGVAAFDIKTSGGDDGITINDSGSIEFFHKGLKILDTFQNGSAHYLNIYATTGQYGYMYHDGSLLRYVNTSIGGGVQLIAKDNVSAFRTGFAFNPNAGVSLYHTGNLAFETTEYGFTASTSAGSTVFETIATGLQAGGSTFDIKTSTGQDAIKLINIGAAAFYYNTEKSFEVSYRSIRAGQTVLSINTVLAEKSIVMTSNQGVQLYWNDNLSFETNPAGMQLHGGQFYPTASCLIGFVSTTNLQFGHGENSSEFTFRARSSVGAQDNILSITYDGITVNGGGSTKFETTSTGAAVTGDLEYLNISTVTAQATASNADVILADGTGGAFTVYLTEKDRAIIRVKKIDSSNTITIQGLSGTIDGSASTTLTSQYQSKTFVCDGSNWYIV